MEATQVAKTKQISQLFRTTLFIKLKSDIHNEVYVHKVPL